MHCVVFLPIQIVLGRMHWPQNHLLKQLFITGATDTCNFEQTLYFIRKRIEKRISHKDFYIVSLSSKNIIYKGMLTSMQVREYFTDLTHPYFTSGMALVTHASVRIRFPHGVWRSLSDCWLIMVRLIQFVEIENGWKRVKVCCPQKYFLT